MEDGLKRFLAFASRTLAVAETKYSQLDKERLAITCGIKEFCVMADDSLSSRIISLYNIHVYEVTKPAPTLTSARLQRLALMLGVYDYQIIYSPGSILANADGRSHLPLPESPTKVPLPILLLDGLCLTPVNNRVIKDSADKDPVLSRI